MMARVLVVDDDPLFRRAMRRILSRAGHDVLLASNARDALRVLDREEWDIVITDLDMPGMDGVELVCEIQRRFPHDAPPVVLVSSHSEPQGACFAAVHPKPVDRCALIAEIERFARTNTGTLPRPAAVQRDAARRRRCE